jgi:hypothetical protein
LDLDVLLGDKSQRQFSGSRQSRILSDDDKGTPNMAIQGFIPILSIAPNHNKVDKDKNKTPHKLDLDANNNEQINAYAGQTESGYAGPQDGKFIGAALQNLASKISGKPRRKYGQDNGQQGDCVCVPFYMCKKGYIESSMAKNFNGQFQQNYQGLQHGHQGIQQNHQAFQHNHQGLHHNHQGVPSHHQIPNQLSGYEATIASAQQEINNANLNQYYQSESQNTPQEYPLVDERSIDGSNKNKNEVFKFNYNLIFSVINLYFTPFRHQIR